MVRLAGLTDARPTWVWATHSASGLSEELHKPGRVPGGGEGHVQERTSEVDFGTWAAVALGLAAIA